MAKGVIQDSLIPLNPEDGYILISKSAHAGAAWFDVTSVSNSIQHGGW